MSQSPKSCTNRQKNHEPIDKNVSVGHKTEIFDPETDRGNVFGYCQCTEPNHGPPGPVPLVAPKNRPFWTHSGPILGRCGPVFTIFQPFLPPAGCPRGPGGAPAASCKSIEGSCGVETGSGSPRPLWVPLGGFSTKSHEPFEEPFG